ncbi:MAG: hypothetical protein ACRDBO_19805 [Lachnospiraceae bacterium]
MSQYTYRLNPGKRNEEKHAYKRSQLELMTTFQLREICRNERLVTSAVKPLEWEGLIQLIMRFRGRKEYRHITEHNKAGWERLQEVLYKVPIQISESDQIRIPASLVLYNDIALDEQDGYQVEAAPGFLYEGNLLLVDESLQVYTCCYLKEEGGKYWICKGKEVEIRESQKHQYAFLYFPTERHSEYLYEQYQGLESNFPGTIRAVQIPLLDLEVKTAERIELPLVIDFGSCNTTMGICMPDGCKKIAASQDGYVIPSVVGVAGMNGNEPEYVFGREAAHLCRNNYQDQDVPVFYDIKRWISDPNRMESVILQSGIKAEVSRREMLKAFFLHLLELARKQFKYTFVTIQLLAPIRQKEKFQVLFADMLPGITVDSSLDEGMAVLFSNVDKLLEQECYEPDHWYRALIIDCGGGTTDLTSCRFRIQNNRVSYTINLETSYEDGDTNFGGNNLTYRILQLLKIRICEKLTGNRSEGIKNPNEEYNEAEVVLPTAFQDYIDKERDSYFSVKNNYYYLFEMAEQVKKLFFQNDFRYELWMGTEKENELILDKWKLSTVQGGKLCRLDKNIRFRLYLHQIEDLLRPDIYQLMDRFLKPKFLMNELQEYDMIKLTGQSCRSRLFEEALKEYVPGILIQRGERKTDGSELKMCCLEGALSYFFNHQLGYMNVNSHYHVGALPYEIMAYTHENKPQILIRSMDREGFIGYISRFKVGKQLDIHILDSQGKHLKTCYYECGIREFKQVTQEEIDFEYSGTVIQEETDIILEGEMKFFIWADRQRWGFIVLPVRREHDLLYKGNETFFDFEDDTWEKNFFDGRK